MAVGDERDRIPGVRWVRVRVAPGKDGPALDSTKTDRLIALLHAQRGEAALRSVEVPGSRAWFDSSTRLETLNRLIMRLGSTATEPAGRDSERDRRAHADDPPG